MSNKDIIKQFIIIRDYEEYIKKNKGRQIAYDRIIKNLSAIKEKITNVKQLKGKKGIGPKTIAKINEYLTTGKIKVVIEAEKALKEHFSPKPKKLPRKLHVRKGTKKVAPPPRNERERVMLELKKLYGVGEVTATNLWIKGVRSVEDLEKNMNLLSKVSQKAFPYRKNIQKRLPRKFVMEYTLALRLLFNRKFGKDSYKMVVAGSYRRKKPTSGDIDILLLSDKITLKQIIDFLNKKNMIAVNLTRDGNYKYLSIAKWPNEDCGDHPFRLDILLVPRDEWATSIAYFTGSYEYNTAMRQRALDLGYKTLNEHHLKRRDGTNVKLDKEEDLWNILGLDYVEPEYREPK